jgi:hypothetical protein
MVLNKLLRKDQAEEIYQNKSKDAADKIKVVKKKTGKKILIYILLIVFSAGAGFTGMTLMATNNSNGKKLQGSYLQFPGIQQHNQGIPLSAAPRLQQVHIQNAEGKKQRAERTVHYAEDATQKVDDLTRSARRTTRNAEERDVFKEFYLRHAAPGATLTKGLAIHLEQNLPDLTRLSDANSGAQALPPVQTLNTAPINEQPREVKIYGITCIGDTGLLVDRCVAITSEGVLKKGDKIGSETVFTVNKTFFETSKRTVEFN